MTSSGVRRQARAVRDEQPAELDRHRRQRHHLPVDERDPAVVERRDVGELEVAVEAGARQAAERGEQRRGSADEALDQVARGRRRPPIERVPAVEEPLADREPLGPIALGGRPRQQQQALGEGTPRPVPVGGRRAVVGPGHRMHARDGVEDEIERRRRRRAPPTG